MGHRHAKFASLHKELGYTAYKLIKSSSDNNNKIVNSGNSLYLIWNSEIQLLGENIIEYDTLSTSKYFILAIYNYTLPPSRIFSELPKKWLRVYDIDSLNEVLYHEFNDTESYKTTVTDSIVCVVTRREKFDNTRNAIFWNMENKTVRIFENIFSTTFVTGNFTTPSKYYIIRHLTGIRSLYDASLDKSIFLFSKKSFDASKWVFKDNLICGVVGNKTICFDTNGKFVKEENISPIENKVEPSKNNRDTLEDTCDTLEDTCDTLEDTRDTLEDTRDTLEEDEENIALIQLVNVLKK